MISMQIFNGTFVAMAGLVVAAFALAVLIMAVPRVSYPGQPSQPPRGGTRPDTSPGPLPDADDDLFRVPDDARELTGDRELALV
jgi:hypothetical protein